MIDTNVVLGSVRVVSAAAIAKQIPRAWWVSSNTVYTSLHQCFEKGDWVGSIPDSIPGRPCLSAPLIGACSKPVRPCYQEEWKCETQNHQGVNKPPCHLRSPMHQAWMVLNCRLPSVHWR